MLSYTFTPDPTSHTRLTTTIPSTYETLQARLQLRTIPALDGIRALAVFAVIFYHFGFERISGGHGVMAFFVLSGFLITWLLIGENQRTGTVSVRAFYARRALRILPAFYAYWFAMVALLWLTHKPMPWANAVSAFFFVSNYYSAFAGHPANAFSHTWSLAVEEQFYLLWPAIFVVWRHDLRRLTQVLVGLIGLAWAWRIVLKFCTGATTSYFYSAFDTRYDHLLIGCLVAVVLRRGLCRSVCEAVTRHAALPFLTLGLLFCSIAFGSRLTPYYRDLIGFAIDPLLLALLIVQWITLSAHPLWRWLDWPALRFLGRISYSLYLYQQVTLYPVRKLLAAHPVWLQLLVAVLVTIAAAAASYFIIERPFLRWKRRFQTDLPS